MQPLESTGTMLINLMASDGVGHIIADLVNEVTPAYRQNAAQGYFDKATLQAALDYPYSHLSSALQLHLQRLKTAKILAAKKQSCVDFIAKIEATMAMLLDIAENDAIPIAPAEEIKTLQGYIDDMNAEITALNAREAALQAMTTDIQTLLEEQRAAWQTHRADNVARSQAQLEKLLNTPLLQDEVDKLHECWSMCDIKERYAELSIELPLTDKQIRKEPNATLILHHYLIAREVKGRG